MAVVVTAIATVTVATPVGKSDTRWYQEAHLRDRKGPGIKPGSFFLFVFRRVRAIIEANGEWRTMTSLTNDTKRVAGTICGLDMVRWGIEGLFVWQCICA